MCTVLPRHQNHCWKRTSLRRAESGLPPNKRKEAKRIKKRGEDERFTRGLVHQEKPKLLIFKNKSASVKDKVNDKHKNYVI